MKPYYEQDGITIYHGDCREIDAWLAADVLVTDPPYGMAWPPGELRSRKWTTAEITEQVTNDHDVTTRDQALDAWGKKPAVIFGTWRKARPDNVTHRLIWHKAGRYPGVAAHAIFPNDEEIYMVGAGWVGSPMASVITTHEQRSAQPGIVGHPTPKPVSLMIRLIEKCPPGVIADPFMGAGATLVAARDIGRKAIGIELEERYCEIAANRLAQGVLDFGGVA